MLYPPGQLERNEIFSPPFQCGLLLEVEEVNTAVPVKEHPEELPVIYQLPHSPPDSLLIVSLYPLLIIRRQ